MLLMRDMHRFTPTPVETGTGKKMEKSMKHINMSSGWEFGTDPFAAFRCNLVYGRNKRDREFLPVKDVTPVTSFTVSIDFGKTVLYDGPDKAAAEAAKAKHEAAAGIYGYAKLESNQFKLLPEGQFRIIKTKEKGTILVVPGSDNTNRCLLFVGCAGGFRGGVGLIKEGTTGTVLKECSASNACESSIEVIALLEVGQSITFHTSGRRTDEVYQYTWDGTQVVKKHYSAEEWRTRNAVAAPPIEDAEVL